MIRIIDTVFVIIYCIINTDYVKKIAIKSIIAENLMI